MTLGEVTDAGVADAGDVHRLLHAELHIGLAACQIHVTHQHVGEGDGFVADGDGEVVGTARLHSGEVGDKVSVGVELSNRTIQSGGAVTHTLAEEGDGTATL